MSSPTNDELRQGRTRTEDSLTERKTVNDLRDARKTVVAFANAVPIGKYGLLYIDVRDDGSIETGRDLDRAQQTLDDKLKDVYCPHGLCSNPQRSRTSQSITSTCVRRPGALASGRSQVTIVASIASASRLSIPSRRAEERNGTQTLTHARAQQVDPPVQLSPPERAEAPSNRRRRYRLHH